MGFFYGGASEGLMQLHYTDRRSVLAGLATGALSAMAGCASLNQLTSNATGDGPTRYVPNKDGWGGSSTIGWSSPATVWKHRDALLEADTYSTLEVLRPQNPALEMADIETVLRTSMPWVTVIEGSFSADQYLSGERVRDDAHQETYRGYELLENPDYRKRTVAVRDGRGIWAKKRDAGIQPTRAVRDVIDTLAGDTDSYVDAHPDYGAMEAALDTDLLYGFYPSGFSQDWELVRSFGYSLTILEVGQYRVRNAFAFNEDTDLSSFDLENYVGVETAPWGSFASPTFETVGNLAVASGTGPLTDL